MEKQVFKYEWLNLFDEKRPAILQGITLAVCLIVLKMETEGLKALKIEGFGLVEMKKGEQVKFVFTPDKALQKAIKGLPITSDEIESYLRQML